MGKAMIVSGGEGGLYQVEIIRDLSRLNSRKMDAEQAINDAEAVIETLKAQEGEALYQFELAADQEAAALSQYQKEILTEGHSSVDLAEFNAAVMQRGAELDRIRGEVRAQQLKIKAAEVRIALVNGELAKQAEVVEVWCTDLTENLMGEVGTLEINGVADQVLIKPKGGAYNSSSDGVLQPVLASTPAATFLNLAFQPGWQKWKPTFRAATVTAVYEGADLCDISLAGAISERGSFGINLKPSYQGVPIDYMDCGDTAFAVGDNVVVQFEGQNPNHPKVIGFLNNPKACELESGLLWYNTAQDRWKLTTNNGSFLRYLAQGPVETFAASPQPSSPHVSGINGNYTLWRNAAKKPDVVRVAPEGFAGSGTPLSSYRLYDDSDQVCWVVVTASGGSLGVWLHSAVAGSKALVSFDVPSHLSGELANNISGEPVFLYATPRGDKAVLQIVSNLKQKSEDLRYSVPWVQFCKVLSFSGTLDELGEGITVTASDYSSPYSSGTATLSDQRAIISAKDSYGFSMQALSVDRAESVDAPALICIDSAGQLSEYSVQLSFNLTTGSELSRVQDFSFSLHRDGGELVNIVHAYDFKRFSRPDTTSSGYYVWSYFDYHYFRVDGQGYSWPTGSTAAIPYLFLRHSNYGLTLSLFEARFFTIDQPYGHAYHKFSRYFAESGDGEFSGKFGASIAGMGKLSRWTYKPITGVPGTTEEYYGGAFTEDGYFTRDTTSLIADVVTNGRDGTAKRFLMSPYSQSSGFGNLPAPNNSWIPVSYT